MTVDDVLKLREAGAVRIACSAGKLSFVEFTPKASAQTPRLAPRAGTDPLDVALKSIEDRQREVDADHELLFHSSEGS